MKHRRPAAAGRLLCLAGWLAAGVLLGTAGGATAQTAGSGGGAGTPAPLAGLQAREAILVEVDTGTTLFARDPDAEVPIASTTKLMTAYVTLERKPLERVLVAQPYDAEVGESLAHLTVGRGYSVASLLRGLLIPSGNDAAHTLAIDVGGSTANFVALMNAAAAKLGLTRTHYATPVGLDTPGNYSTAANLATLAQVLMRNWFFAKVVREPDADLPDGTELENSDDLIGEYPWLVGVKTGHTADAGYCLVGAASDGGVHLISVVLGDPSNAARDADTLALLRYGLHLYRRVPIAVAGRTYLDVFTNGSTTGHVALAAERGASIVVPRSIRVAASISAPPMVHGPIAAGADEGAIVVREDGRVALEVPLVTVSAVRGAGGAGIVVLVLLAVALAIVLAASLMLMRRRARGSAGKGAPR